MDITALCKRHLTDKCSGQYPHSELYDRLFSSFRDRPITLLEIGVHGGNSIPVWEGYFPQAMIHAVDIKGSCLCFETERTRVDMVDQSDKVQLSVYATKYGPFDIIIDDGSHMVSHQIESFNTLWPHIKSGGLYVIEDTLTSFDARYIDSNPTCIEYFKDAIDSVSSLKKDRLNQFKDIYTIMFKQDMIVVEKEKE